MAVISQDLANQISFKLTDKSRIVAENLHAAFRELVTAFYEDQIPDEIKKIFKKFPDWFETRTQIRLNSHGFNWEHVSTTRPVVTNSHGNCELKLTNAIADKLLVAQRKWHKAKEQYDTLRKEARQALLTLKTYNNIRKELPEATPFLPPPISNALVVNFSSLKSKLKKQPEQKEVKVEIED